MAMTFTAPFAQAPKAVGVTLSAATPIDGSTATLLLTAGVNGCIVTKATVMPTATLGTAAGVVLYLQTSGGAIKVLKEGVTVPAYVYAATAKPASASFSPTESTPIRLGAGDSLYVGTLVAGAIAVTAEYSDF